MTLHPIVLLLLIPVISATIGYVTNVLAVKMMFYPTKFIGLPPYLGWQGIVPANAVKLARTGLQLITSQLLKPRELFEEDQIDDFFVGADDDMQAMTRRVIEEKAQENFGAMWGALSDSIKEQVHSVAWNEVRQMSRDVLEEIIENIDDVLNLQNVVEQAVRRDAKLMSKMFLEIGSAEFTFIERSGFTFGAMFGIVQLAVWVIYPAWWVLPLFGFLVGWATNWLAIKLIFEPRQPVRFLWMTFHGLFHQRQKEVTIRFSEMVASDVLTDANMFRELGTERSRKLILDMVDRRTNAAIEKYRANPMAAGMMQPALIDRIRGDVMTAVEDEMFKDGGVLASVTRKSGQIRDTLRHRMLLMDPHGFENVLRPAFQEDEWKLILSGAILGFLAGLAQLVYLFGRAIGS